MSKNLQPFLLSLIKDEDIKEINDFVLTKGYFKDKPYVNIYTKESYKKARAYLDNQTTLNLLRELK